MLTINLASDQVQVTEVEEVVPIGEMSQAEARQKLDTVKSHFEQAEYILRKDVKSHIKQAISILLDIDETHGWKDLGYESMHQMITAEITCASVSQIYRKFNATKVRKELSPMCENVDVIPDNHLAELGKLPSNEWGDTLEEITATAPKGKVTAKYVKEIVTRRLQKQASADEQRALQTGNKVEDLHDDDSNSCKNYESPGFDMEPERHDVNFDTDSNPRALSSSAIEVQNIVTIHCGVNASPEQQQHSGCWGIIEHLSEQSAFVRVGGEVVEYPSANINQVQNPSPLLTQVCDCINNLWQIPNLPAPVEYLLGNFYQRRLDFSQEDLDVLTIIESFYQARLSQEYYPIATPDSVEEYGIKNQIPSIMSAIE